MGPARPARTGVRPRHGAGLLEVALFAGLLSSLVFVLPVMVWLRYLFLGALLAMAYRHRALVLPLLLRWAVVLALPALMLISCLWSPDPMAALLYAGVVGVTVIVCFYVGARFDWRQIVFVLILVLGVAALLSLADLNTRAVYTPNQEAALGIFSQKNVLGKRMMVLAVAGVAVLTERSFPAWQRLVALAVTGPALFLVVQSNSTTALLLTSAGMASVFTFTVVWRNLRRVRGGLGFFFGLVACTLLLGALAYSAVSADPIGDFLGLFGKGSDLTGRTVLWAQAAEQIRANPIIGSGMQGFWRPNSSDALQIAAQFTGDEGTYRFNFQNAYLEYGVHLGYPGLLVFSLVLFSGFLAIAGDFVRHHDTRGALFVVLTSLVVIRTFTESELFRDFEVNAVLLWIAIALAAQRRVSVMVDGSAET